VKKEGSRFIGELNATLIRDSEGKPRAIIGSTRDITERKRAEEQIKQSIKEKEVLLREIQHRVKNNMQVISSLLNLQSAHIKDSQYKEMLKESQNRIRSMALIHERSYQSENLADIDFHEYIASLVRGLFRSYNATADRVSLVIEVEDVSLGMDTAVPCGLIINELVSNSLKHAFPRGRKGEIKIVLRSVCELIELTVADNGVGISEDVDFRTTESLGLDLVTTLAEYQLGGEITLDRTEGTVFCITFEGVK
jgi:two-component sensor histidine kinase